MKYEKKHKERLISGQEISFTLLGYRRGRQNSRRLGVLLLFGWPSTVNLICLTYADPT